MAEQQAEIRLRVNATGVYQVVNATPDAAPAAAAADSSAVANGNAAGTILAVLFFIGAVAVLVSVHGINRAKQSSAATHPALPPKPLLEQLAESDARAAKLYADLQASQARNTKLHDDLQAAQKQVNELRAKLAMSTASGPSSVRAAIRAALVHAIHPNQTNSEVEKVFRTQVWKVVWPLLEKEKAKEHA